MATDELWSAVEQILSTADLGAEGKELRRLLALHQQCSDRESMLRRIHLGMLTELSTYATKLKRVETYGDSVSWGDPPTAAAAQGVDLSERNVALLQMVQHLSTTFRAGQLAHQSQPMRTSTAATATNTVVGTSASGGAVGAGAGAGAGAGGTAFAYHTASPLASAPSTATAPATALPTTTTTSIMPATTTETATSGSGALPTVTSATVDL